eukprot:CCRYP_009033-RA/>CCRYP_009033-RA protein AED:0.24 eAED:0.24 QI:178/1/1/1/1/1/2/918/553
MKAILRSQRLVSLDTRSLTVLAFLIISCCHTHSGCFQGRKSTFVLLLHAADAADVGAAHFSPGVSSVVTSSPIDTSEKFQSYGPTLTLTLRDPSVPSIADARSRTNSKNTALVSSQVSNVPPNYVRPSMSIESSFGGLSARLAALFRINSSASPVSEPSQSPSRFASGYMVDGGNIILGPPSESSHDKLTKDFFPLFGGLGQLKSLSDCVGNMQPEIAYEIKTRATSTYGDDDRNNNIHEIDWRPFPKTLPWVTAVSCGLKWWPFPTYKPGEGYGHKLMSVPHFVRCGATICLPRVSGILKPWRTSVNNNQSSGTVIKRKNLDFDVTYLDDVNRHGGRLEVLLGRSTPYLKPRFVEHSRNPGQNNHILACFTTGSRKGKLEGKSPSAPSIEYLRGSFRVLLPSFLRNRTQQGVSVAPSYDFVEGKARFVVSGGVGTSGRTSAVLRFDSDDSTLTVVRALDESKVIAPTISLQTGKIVYDWYIGLNNKDKNNRSSVSSIRAHVDPTNCIRVLWTDSITGRTEGNCWVSEVRVPLGITSSGSRIADIRVGRRWVI